MSTPQTALLLGIGGSSDAANLLLFGFANTSSPPPATGGKAVQNLFVPANYFRSLFQGSVTPEVRLVWMPQGGPPTASG